MRSKPKQFLEYHRWIFALFLFAFSSVSADDDSLEVKWVNAHKFDKSLIPAQEIYGTCWDSLHVDSPCFNIAVLSNGGFPLKLVESDCKYAHPFHGEINSRFGWRWNRMHKGMDIDLQIGDPILSAFDGVVRIVKNDYYGFGNYILIRHYNGLETIYAHLSRFNVIPNQTVRSGEIIGYGGNTGRSTGPHLHFETRFMGQAFDPSNIIDFEAFTLKATSTVIVEDWFLYYLNPYKYQAQFAQYYKIRKGDTLGHIARRHGTTVSALCRLNGINRNTILRVGKVIRVR